VVNSSINVVIYCFMGRQFRAILLHMIGCGGERANARTNPEVDPGHAVGPLHHVLTPHQAEQSWSGREGPMSRQSAVDDALRQMDEVVDVHEMPFEAELDTRGVGRTSTPLGDNVDNSQDTQA